MLLWASSLKITWGEIPKSNTFYAPPNGQELIHLGQVGGFLRFPPSVKMIAMI